jgi:hypothetical protein
LDEKKNLQEKRIWKEPNVKCFRSKMFSYGITVGIPNQARTDHNPSNLSQPDLNLTFLDDKTNDTKNSLNL